MCNVFTILNYNTNNIRCADVYNNRCAAYSVIQVRLEYISTKKNIDTLPTTLNIYQEAEINR